MQAFGLYVFDFDGVICDSARETGTSAWRAGGKLWPEWSTSEPPASFLNRFCRLRPFLETGYQAVGLMRMAATTDFAEGELSSESVVEWIDQLYSALGVSREEMVVLFGRARDEWIANDLRGWLAKHRFYPGLSNLVAELQRRARLCILSTKQERFIHELLAANGLSIPPDCVHGFESGEPKPETLKRLRRECGSEGAIAFVEDRLETLETVIAASTLKEVKLFLATWGYNTEAQRNRAEAEPRIESISLADMGKHLLST